MNKKRSLASLNIHCPEKRTTELKTRIKTYGKT